MDFVLQCDIFIAVKRFSMRWYFLEHTCAIYQGLILPTDNHGAG